MKFKETDYLEKSGICLPDHKDTGMKELK